MLTDKEYVKLHYELSADEKEGNTEIIEYNKQLTEKYPFLLPKNEYTGKVIDSYDYIYSVLDDMPDGWRLKFGLQMCEEIKQALIKHNHLDDYIILQIKEKYGSLRWYASYEPEELSDIIDKYEEISSHTCLFCGEEAEYLTKGWITPICEKCAKEHIEKENSLLEKRKETCGGEVKLHTLEDLVTKLDGVKRSKMVKLVIKPYEYLPCALEVFTINNIKADICDFGTIDDTPDGNYGCRCSKFVPYSNITEDILEKYHISQNEYNEICNKLKEILYIEDCSLCL